MASLSSSSYFFDSGLQFTCRQCGTCCTGAPGIIRVSADEIDRIVAYLDIPHQQFRRDYLVKWRGALSIGECADGRCRFYDQGCRIYPVRPRQCRAYPFWFEILRAESRWAREAQHCPGIGQGRLYPRAEILKRVTRDMARTAGCQSALENPVSGG